MTDKEDMSSPVANNQTTAPVIHKYPPMTNKQVSLTAPVLPTESEGLPGGLVEGLPGGLIEGLPSEQKQKRATKVSNTAPHRIIHWQNHLDFLKNNLGTCVECKKPGATLEETITTGISTTLRINCETCDTSHNKAYNRYMYLKKKYALEKKGSKDADRKTYYLLEYAKKKLEKMQMNTRNRTSRPSFTEHISAREKQNFRLEDFELNLRAVMASFYIGSGCEDVASVVSFLGLPGGKSLSRSMSTKAEEINEQLLSVCKTVVAEGLKQEIAATIHEILKDKYTYNEITQYIHDFNEGNFKDLPEEIVILGLAVSYDMGWQKRSTGRRYDSMSGHGFMIGCRTGLIIGLDVRGKKCAKCHQANKKNLPVRDHKCPINYEGSSGAMESKVALSLTEQIFNNSNGHLYVKHLVSDDDSTMRSLLTHQNENNKKGRLPEQIPAITFYADPSHRVKVMAKPVYGKVTDTKDPTKCKKHDADRLKKYIGCYISKSKHLPLEEFCLKARAPVEHLFNCHEWCDGSWCWAKELSDKAFDEIMSKKEKDDVQLNDSISRSGDDQLNDNISQPDDSSYDSTGSDYYDNGSDRSDEEGDEETLAMSTEEKVDVKQLFAFEASYLDDEEGAIFSVSDRERLRERELAMMKRNTEGYYRCKIKHAALYEEMTGDLARFLVPEMMGMLQHDWSTQINEAMNQSVASYAPKNKTYSKSTSLLVRVNIAAAVQIIGHASLWRRIFIEFGLTIDANLKDILTAKDKKKMRKKIKDQTKEGKTVRSTVKYENLAAGHKAQMADLQKGDQYESGIAVAAARKSIKAAPKRNEGPKETWTCIYYHPDYCYAKGHKDCRSPLCAMKKHSVEERKAALKVIESARVEQEIMKISTGKNLFYCVSIHQNLYDDTSVLVS